jgi:hypothetical protein
MAALVAPILSTVPEIPFRNYRPQLNLSTPVEALSPEESALGVLAQVAHELEPTITADYFADHNILPPDLADSLIQMYHPLTQREILMQVTLLTSIHCSPSSIKRRFSIPIIEHPQSPFCLIILPGQSSSLQVTFPRIHDYYLAHILVPALKNTSKSRQSGTL